jgi:hypothetical protein
MENGMIGKSPIESIGEKCFKNLLKFRLEREIQPRKNQSSILG